MITVRAEHADWAEAVGLRIKRRLEEFDMTQRELARKTGISEADISRVIRGIYVMRTDTFIKITNALNMDANELLKLYKI